MIMVCFTLSLIVCRTEEKREFLAGKRNSKKTNMARESEQTWRRRDKGGKSRWHQKAFGFYEKNVRTLGSLLQRRDRL